MKKNIAAALIASVFMLGGCSNKSVSLNVKDEDITSHKEKAHIIFSRPKNILTSMSSIDIVEFDKHSYEPRLVTVLTSNDKSIYSVEEGEHYIYSNMGLIGNILMIKVLKGKTYFIDTDLNQRGMFIPANPIALEEDRLNLKSELEKSSCSQKLLNQYLFHADKNEGTVNTYSSPIHFTIQCDHHKILSVKDEYYKNSIKELTSPMTVIPSSKIIQEFENNKATITANIKSYFPIWKAKFKDIPLTESTFLVVEKQIPDNYIGKFDAVQLEDMTINKNIEKDFLAEILKDLSKEFELENKDTKALHINFMVNNYDSGSMIGRYFASPFSDPRTNYAVIDVSVIFTDENNIEIGKIRITEVEAGGVLGGVNTLKSDIISVIAEYTRRNLLKTSLVKQ